MGERAFKEKEEEKGAFLFLLKQKRCERALEEGGEERERGGGRRRRRRRRRRIHYTRTSDALLGEVLDGLVVERDVAVQCVIIAEEEASAGGLAAARVSDLLG